jgi:hypothetical protein
MRLATYNPDQGRRELGLGLGMIAPAWQRGGTNEQILFNLFARSKIFLRDGSVAYTGSTVLRQNPATGEVKTGALDYNHVMPCGLALPMRYCGQPWINLCPVCSGAGTGLASNTKTGLARSLVEDTSTGDHYVSTAIASDIPDNTPHTIVGIVSRVSGSRHGFVRIFSGANAGDLVVNLDTGAVAVFSAGTVTASAATTRALGSGRYHVSFQITSTNFGASQAILFGINENGSTPDANFTGDGASGVTYEGFTIVAGTVIPPNVAEGATAAADLSPWTTGAPNNSVSGELTIIEAPIGWSAAALGANPFAVDINLAYAVSGVDVLYRTGTNSEGALKTDGALQNTLLGSLAEAENTLRMHGMQWDSTALRYYRGPTLAREDATLSPPWVNRVSWYIGSGGGGVSSWRGFCAAIEAPGGMTAAERAAFSRQVTGAVIRRAA